MPYPVDTGRKLNVNKTFRRCPGRLLNVLCAFNLRPVSTGKFLRTNYLVVFCKKGILKNLTKFTGKQKQVFFLKSCSFSGKIFSLKYFPVNIVKVDFYLYVKLLITGHINLIKFVESNKVDNDSTKIWRIFVFFLFKKENVFYSSN